MMEFFDANEVAPQQSTGKHPPGMFDFVISNTRIQPTKDDSGAMLVVEFKSEAGVMFNRYNLSNKSEQAVKIAKGELSALCHAVGIFRITFPKDQSGQPNMLMAAAELRGGRGRMEVAPQKLDEPDGYMEIKKVFDIHGNEPGKGAPGQGQQAASTGWGSPAPAANAGAANGAATTQVAPTTQQAPAGWLAAPAGEAPPWAK